MLILIDDASCLDITTWTLTAPTVWFDLTKRLSQPWNLHTHKKTKSFAACYRISFIRKKEKFTDGSKTEEGVAAADVSTKHIREPFTYRLPDDSSVFTAELWSILLALKCVYCSKEESFFDIVNFLSSLQATYNRKYHNAILVQLLKLLMELTWHGKKIVFIWGH